MPSSPFEAHIKKIFNYVTPMMWDEKSEFNG